MYVFKNVWFVFQARLAFVFMFDIFSPFELSKRCVHMGLCTISLLFLFLQDKTVFPLNVCLLKFFSFEYYT